MSDGLTMLRGLDGKRIAAHLEGRAEFTRAFPLFFRVVGDEVCRRLAARYPDARAWVGEDSRGEAIDRWGQLLPPLDWVAFSFPGYAMWDLHVGVVARLDTWPPVCQAGIHWTAAARSVIEPLVRGVDWRAAVGEAGEWEESPAVGEIQQRDLARPLGLGELGSEALRFAERAVAYYTVVRPLLER